jgi:hypothetical protein
LITGGRLFLTAHSRTNFCRARSPPYPAICSFDLDFHHSLDGDTLYSAFQALSTVNKSTSFAPPWAIGVKKPNSEAAKPAGVSRFK